VKLFIAGCARSGTSLLWRLLPGFEDMHIPSGMEQPASILPQIEIPGKHAAVKRTAKCYRTLHQLPDDIGLIYSVRHPFDTLTSYNREKPFRKYYVWERRWRKEYAALKRLQAAQPKRKIVYVRYSDLVSDPDRVQREIGDTFGLAIKQPFSSMQPVHKRSMNKFETNPAYRRYLWLLPHDFRAEIAEFCREFGLDVPPGYVRPPSMIADFARRVVTRQMAKDWNYILRGRTPPRRTVPTTQAPTAT
jgi:hypothetical protein